MRRIILLALFIVVVLVGCSKSKSNVQEDVEIIHAQSVKIPHTESYIHHVEENEYVVTDRNGRIQKYCTVESSTGETESIIGENSNSIGEANRTHQDESSNDSESVPELVESESVSETELEGQLGEYSGFSEDGYSDGYTDESEVGLTYLGNWTITAYCPCEICCGEWATGCTASGVLATSNHTVACGILPFGTQVMIDGIIYTVEDTGVDGEWIDIFFDSHEEALCYGMQIKEVYLVG